jgi:hypothetical protein
VDEGVGGAGIHQGLERDTTNSNLQQHGISRPEASQRVQRDLQGGDVIAERIILALRKVHEEDALCHALVVLGVRLWAEVTLVVLPLLLHLRRHKTTKARARPLCLAVLHTRTR